MMDFGCHRIEVLLNLGGPIVSTKSLNNNVLYERQVEDASAAMFAFASGAQGILTVSHAAFQSRDTLEVYGSEGTLSVENLNAGKLVLRNSNGATVEEHPPHPNLHQPLIEDFNNVLLGAGNEPAVTGATGRAVNAILDEIYR